jgi:hypothetical protein
MYLFISTLKNKPQLFQCLPMQSTNYEIPLVWWAQHVMQFPHVSFLAFEVLGILGSHVEI